VTDPFKFRQNGDRVVLRALATTLIRLAHDVDAASVQAELLLGWKPRRWFRTLIVQILSAPEVRCGGMRRDDLADRLAGHERLCRAIEYSARLNFSAIPTPRMHASQVPGSASVIELNTIGDCLAWLDLRPEELDWFAGRFGDSPDPASPLSHYHFQWVPKPSGGFRLIEAPKRRLKAMQRKIHDQILSHVPPHPAAHAYVPGRSIVSALTPHAGRDIVWRLDLTNYFWSIGSGRVRRLFRTLGYPESVAEILVRLCTHRVPDAILHQHPLPEAERNQARSRHLPQGAPTSPVLSNLCAYRLDARLTALSLKYGAAYTRYADDLVFSGDSEFRRRLPQFRITVLSILIDEGFAIRRRKSRELPRGQQQEVSGLILNERVNIPREDYDTLRATLFNCIRNGPEQENRRQHPHFRDHLLGRIGWIEFVSPGRGQKLRNLFTRITWPADG
jgi:RNA-directed DNA polymerase